MSRALRAGPISQARYEALKILLRVEQDRAFADVAIEHALDRSRLDPRDGALCTEIVYGTLRWQRHLDWRLAAHLERPLPRLDPWVRALLRLSAYQLLFLDRVPAWAAVDEAVSLARLKGKKRGPAEFVNAVLRSLVRAPTPPPPPGPAEEAIAVQWSFPDWIAARWVRRHGLEEARALMAASNERPPITVRTNTLRVSRDVLAARLRDRELVEARATSLAPEGLHIERGPVGRLTAFLEGWCTVQDEASMLVSHLVGAQPGELVADTCAAPGTKATHLAALMRNQGKILALDPQGPRLKLLTAATRRLGATIIEPHAGSVAELASRWRERCDRALVDAPCSNLGIVRRHPEVKWRRAEGELGRLRDRQRLILDAAASMVRSDGVLVYATCSLEPEENEEVVLPFLEAHPEWRVDLPEAFPVPPDGAGIIRLLPHVHGTDGFTAVRLRRAKRA